MEIHESTYIAEGAVVLGDVKTGADSSIWFHATVRADREKITIGEGSNIQDNAVVHVDQGFPVSIGCGVTVGHGAVGAAEYAGAGPFFGDWLPVPDCASGDGAGSGG